MIKCALVPSLSGDGDGTPAPAGPRFAEIGNDPPVPVPDLPESGALRRPRRARLRFPEGVWNSAEVHDREPRREGQARKKCLRANRAKVPK